jgi:glycosyltransferase involved in cell wall biosynthesis
MMLDRLSVFYPAYNEEENIAQTVENTLRVLPEVAREYEVIIINDGSKDRTGEIGEQLSKKYPQVKIIHHPQNRGYGGALKTGMYNSQYEIIAFTDSDGQFDFSEIRYFIPYLQDYDVVIGYRRNRAEGFYRRLNAKAWGLLMRLVFGLQARDIDCAFKVFHQRVIQKIPQLESNGALISAEFLMKAHRSRFKIKEIPVSHFPRVAGKPTGANLRVILKAFHELFILKKKLDQVYHQ